MKEVTVFISTDGNVFENKTDAEAYEKEMSTTVAVPLPIFREMLRQCTPYLVTARERRELLAKLNQLYPEEKVATP